MKHTRFFSYFLILIILAPGCAPLSRPAKTIETTHAEDNTAVLEEPLDSSYYHYTRSEIYKKQAKYDKALEALLKAIKIDPESGFLKKELIALYLHKKDTLKAIEVAQELVKLDPENIDSLMILGKLRQMQNQLSEAKDIYQRILQLNPANEEIYLLLGRMYLDSGDTEEAFRLYTNMAEDFPKSYAPHFFLGKIHIINNNPEYAEQEFLKTLELNSSLLEPRFELIAIYENPETQITAPKIAKLYNEILNIDSSNIRAGLELPLFYHNHGQKKKASALLAEMGKRSIESPGIPIIAAQELIGKKRFKDASVVFTGMLKAVPEDSTLHYLAGISYNAMEETAKAIHHFLKVKPDSEHYRKTIVQIAFSLSENDEKDKAIEFLEKKHRELPDDIDIIMYLGSFYEDGQYYEKSIAIFNKGIALSPKDTTLLFRLGIVQDKIGKKDECIETMKRVIELEPDNASALNYLGYTYADMETNLDLAEEMVKKALSLKPEDGFITDSLGWVYYKKGLFSKAVTILEKAVELTEFDPVITEHLGDAYRKDNKPKKALEAYKKARSKSTETNPGLNTKIEQLEQLLK